MFTAPHEWIDGEGDEIDREMSLMNRTGRIRTLDKDLHGEALTTRSVKHQIKAPDHAARLKAHTVRIQAELWPETNPLKNG